jgi:hypothetical protein
MSARFWIFSLSPRGEGATQIVRSLKFKPNRPAAQVIPAAAAIKNVAAAACLVLSISACTTVGPDFVPLEPALPTAYLQTAGFEAAQVDAAFWQRFNDAQLNALVEQAKKANPDIRLALARLNEVRANLLGAEAAGLPTLRLSATVTRWAAIWPGKLTCLAGCGAALKRPRETCAPARPTCVPRMWRWLQKLPAITCNCAACKRGLAR